MNPAPRHVAIIMDGNGRWAQARGLPRLAGHEQGSKSIGACVEAAIEAGVEFLTLYAFSSENWKRPAQEVRGLMALLERFLDEKVAEMEKENVRLLTIGRTGDLPESCRAKLRAAVERTEHNSRLTVVLALSYSGRQEIVDAVRRIVAAARDGRVSPDDVTPEFVASHLDTANIPDPDLLIRTSGELRLSNFLLWQLSYTEIHVSQHLWPDFGKNEFLAAIADYHTRKRRFGGV
jgi:undecaprenyl diphosphate synthase